MAVNENLRKSADIIFGGNVLSDSTIMLNKKFQKEIWNSKGAAPCCISKYAVNADGSGISGENSLIEVTGRINGIFNAGSTIYEYKSVLSVCEGENPWGRIISADKPWSGYFSISCGLWGAAHFTHLQRKTGRLYLPETEKKQEIIRSLFQKREIIPQYLQIIRINRRNTVFASETLKSGRFYSLC